MGIRTWVYGRLIFLKSKVSLSRQRRKLMVFLASDKMQAFEQKLEFWKTCISHREVDSFLYLEDFSVRISNIVNKCGF